jgi:hypothetical protein
VRREPRQKTPCCQLLLQRGWDEPQIGSFDHRQIRDEIARAIYWGMGTLIGAVAGIATFLAVYLLAIDSVGWAAGIALGWIPAVIAAAVVAVLLRCFWPAVLFLLLAAIRA